MKKILILTIVALLLIFSVKQTFAANLNIYIDDIQIPMAPHFFYVASMKVEESKFSMDVPPQIYNGSAFVPVRTVANFWNAEIHWQNFSISLSFNDVVLDLTIGSTTAFKNGNPITLQAAPYISNGRTMVPLRFISEAFGCEVHFANGNVYIITMPLKIMDREVVSVQNWIGMTMGGLRFENKANISVNKLYRLIRDSQGNEISAPDYFCRLVPGEFHNFYMMEREISFMESAGLEGLVIKRFDLYIRVNDDPNHADLYLHQGTDHGKRLIHDVTHDIWYKVTSDDFLRDFWEIYDIGEWELILNNVV